MYKVKIYHLGDTNEYEYCYKGNYGARGEKRVKKCRVTSEYQAKLNQKHKEKNMRRLIKLNFREGDLWVTLKYPAGRRPPVKEVQSDRAEFIRRMRKPYKAAGIPFKFIYRVEIGKQGGIHLHFIINNPRCFDVQEEIRKAWSFGHVNFEFMYRDGGFEALSEYITKPAESDTGQMYFDGMGMEDKKAFMRYGSSRNLERPVPEVREYSHWTMHRIIDNDGPKASPGYYIEKDSIRQGINPYTGYSYLSYTERRLKWEESPYTSKHPPRLAGSRQVPMCT